MDCALKYDMIQFKLQEKVNELSKKLSGKDAPFYSQLIAKLQAQLDNLNAKCSDGVTHQDLIVAWQTYREVNQEKKIKFYSDHKWGIVGLAVLVGAIGVNVYYTLNKKE